MTDVNEPTTATNNASTEISGVYADLLSWGSDLSVWQNELVRRVVKGDSLGDEDIKVFALASMMEAEQQTVEFTRLCKKDFPATVASGTGVQLTSIGNLENVNALRSDQVLRFGPSLTVVYGRNASGKSGYARVLKRVFRARVVEDILPNLRDPSSTAGVAKATLEFHSDGEIPNSWIWSNDDDAVLPEQFARFAVLDDKCSRTYIKDSELQFAPQGLDVPERVAVEMDRVQKLLKDWATNARVSKQPLEQLANSTEPGKFVASLSSTTSPEQVAEHTKFDESDQAELERLVTAIANAKNDTPDAKRTSLETTRRQLESLRGCLSQAEARVNANAVAQLEAAKSTVVQAEQAAATVRAIGDDDTRDELLGTDPWRSLIRAAMSFVESSGAEQASVAVGDTCSLCWQDLDANARARVHRFVAYLTSDAESQVTSTRRDFEQRVAAIEETPLSLPKAEAEIARGIAPELASVLDRSIQAARARATFLLAVARGESPVSALPELGTQATPAIDAHRSRLDEELAKVGDQAAAAETLRVLEHRRLELETRQHFATLKPMVEQFVQGLRDAQRYEAAEKNINTRQVSAKATELEKRYRTSAFTAAVERELKSELRFARHTPTFATKTSKAKMQMRPAVSNELKGIGADRVFSEGERTAISLACFLAEVSITGDTAGLIFDDPVSSLDEARRSFVARRLAKEAADRQVIVFTHDLTFFADLRRAAEDIKGRNIECESRTLSADEWAVGMVEEDMPFGARSVHDRVKVLKSMIEDTNTAGQAGDSAKARDTCRHFYDLLRATWERFIESEMLGKVVQRLEREVRPALFKDMVDTTEIRTAVVTNYTRCSDVIEAHDKATSAGSTATPTTEDMKADLDELEKARKLVKNGRKLAAQA